MTTLRTAAQQALEALELANVNHWWGSASIEKAITALRAALAQEPATLPGPGLIMCPDCCAQFDPALNRVQAQEQAEQTWVCPDSPEHRYAKPGHCEDCGKTLVLAQAEPVQEPVRNDDTLPDRVVLNNWAADRLARHGIPMPGDDLT